MGSKLIRAPESIITNWKMIIREWISIIQVSKLIKIENHIFIPWQELWSHYCDKWRRIKVAKSLEILDCYVNAGTSELKCKRVALNWGLGWWWKSLIILQYIMHPGIIVYKSPVDPLSLWYRYPGYILGVHIKSFSARYMDFIIGVNSDDCRITGRKSIGIF